VRGLAGDRARNWCLLPATSADWVVGWLIERRDIDRGVLIAVIACVFLFVLTGSLSARWQAS